LTDDPDLVVFTTADLVAAAANNIEAYWESRGKVVEIVDVSPYPIEGRADEIKADIADYANEHGTQSFLLVGDWGDDLTNQLWNASEYWKQMRDEHIEDRRTSSPVTPRIPAFLIEDLEGSPRNAARWSPYILSDQLYGDLDGDSIADVAVGRWPAMSETDIVNATTNLVLHCEGDSQRQRNALLLLGDTDAESGSGDLVALMGESIDSTIGAVSPVDFPRFSRRLLGYTVPEGGVDEQLEIYPRVQG